ncbi:glycosyltransferase family 2 protein [Polynucleobacter necessarius]|uniref:glycosyltransferase family 2 protein n=1 Tax=Polynucleobacter necessarius TaxID=576610 RepID=UPI000E09D3DF|nr:glycosyltransferase family 2 protein [Polynucleobacter necessarius]
MPNPSPLITVAMPVYNGEKYLSDAVQSILSKTITDFEFLIIDDGSIDGSREMLRVFAARDSSIKLIERNNRGFSDTVNEIATLAMGRWFARMDQDDIALLNRFERQIHWLTQESADICGT